jgi:hypothetical protein
LIVTLISCIELKEALKAHGNSSHKPPPTVPDNINGFSGSRKGILRRIDGDGQAAKSRFRPVRELRKALLTSNL